ncbi:MAG: D-xylose transporter XylE [Bacteroidales bacterium]
MSNKEQIKHEGNIAYVTMITLVATLGGLLFGYDTAVISGADKSIENYLTVGLGFSKLIHGATISSALIGCVVGAAFSGLLSSRLGRKPTLMLASFLFFISAIGSAYPELLFFTRGEASVDVLIAFNIYRIIGGIGVGLASAVCPMYIGEIAPANMRGSLVSLNQFAIIFGMLLVYFVNWGIAKGKTDEWINSIGWRRMFLSESIPAALFGLLLFLVPESPRYLVFRGKDDKSLKILSKIGGKSRAAAVLADIKSSMFRARQESDKRSRLFSYGIVLIIVGILLSVFQQFVGINVILYYAPRIFESMGVAKDVSMLQTVVMGIVNVIFTVIAIMTVDNIGRKKLLMIGSIGMALGMFGVSALAFLDIIGIGTLVFIIVYTASFMMSWGPVCWVLISEIFPNKIRSGAVALAVVAQWAANYLVSSTFPALNEFSSGFTFCLYGFMSMLSLIFVWKMVPETKGKTLEEMENLWSKK